MKDHPIQNIINHKIKRSIFKTSSKRSIKSEKEQLKSTTNTKKFNNFFNKNITLSKTQIPTMDKNTKKNAILNSKNTITNIKENSINQTLIPPVEKNKNNRLDKDIVIKKNRYLNLQNSNNLNRRLKLNRTCFKFNRINENNNIEEGRLSSIEKRITDIEIPKTDIDRTFNSSEDRNNKNKVMRNLQTEKEFKHEISCRKLTSDLNSKNYGEKNIRSKIIIPPLKLKTNIINIFNKKLNISSKDFFKIKRLKVNKKNLLNSNLTERNSEKATEEDNTLLLNKKLKTNKNSNLKLDTSSEKINKQNSTHNLIKKNPPIKKTDSKDNINNFSCKLMNKKITIPFQTPRLRIKKSSLSSKKVDEIISNTTPLNKISVIKAPKYKNKRFFSNSINKNNNDNSLNSSISNKHIKIFSSSTILNKNHKAFNAHKIFSLPRPKSQGRFGMKEDDTNIELNNIYNNTINSISERYFTENNINNIPKGNVITTNLINIYSNNGKFSLNNNIYDIQTLNQFNNIQNNNTNIIYFDTNLNYNIVNNNINNTNNLNNNNTINNNSVSVNIEDLIILQQKMKDVMISLKNNKVICHECCEFWNYYFNSSINGKLEILFKNYFESNIVRKSINYELMSIMLCYVYSSELEILSKTNKFLFKILKLNYMNLMIICEHILNKISNESQNNIWVLKLKYIISIFKYDCNEYNKIKEYNNMSLVEKVNYNTNVIIQQLKFILQNYITKKNQQLNILFNKINDKTYKEINNFFRDNILQIENIDGPILASQFLKQYSKFNTVPAPYIRTKNNKNFSLVLDLDETLINFKAQKNGKDGGLLRIRPGLNDFLEEVVKYYELILFTIATKNYADILVDNIEKNKTFFDHRFYREHAIIIDNDFVKDLSRIGRPLDKIIIVDNMPQNFRLQKENGIMIKAFWGEDSYDKALCELGPILVKIAKEGGDLRKGLFKYKDEIKILAY